LKSTTGPYQISGTDQNTNSQPLLNIWELPNNGMDSTNNKADVLIQKFDDNYKQLPLTKPQVLTYMTHAHWLTTIDGKTMRTLLNETDNYKIEKDKGPVIYVTSQQAYDYWVNNYQNL
jgi:hypothetical protein